MFLIFLLFFSPSLGYVDVDGSFLLFLVEVETLSEEYSTLMPKEEDLHGAALALIRLQDTYNLNMTDMAAGRIFDSPAFVQMTGK